LLVTGIGLLCRWEISCSRFAVSVGSVYLYAYFVCLRIS